MNLKYSKQDNKEKRIRNKNRLKKYVCQFNKKDKELKVKEKDIINKIKKNNKNIKALLESLKKNQYIY